MLLSHLHQKPETPEPFCTETPCHSLRRFCLCILCTCVWIIVTVDDNYCNILCLTCLQVQTLIDNDSNLNFCVFLPRIIVPPQHLSHAHYMHFAASSLCHVSVLAIKFFIHAWMGWLLHCYDHVKWTAENGYVENSMWCARWEEEWQKQQRLSVSCLSVPTFPLWRSRMELCVQVLHYRVQSHKRCPLQTRCVFNNFQIDPVQWRQQQRRHIHSSATREIHTVNQLWPLCAYHLFFFFSLRIHLI